MDKIFIPSFLDSESCVGIYPKRIQRTATTDEEISYQILFEDPEDPEAWYVKNRFTEKEMLEFIEKLKKYVSNNPSFMYYNGMNRYLVLGILKCYNEYLKWIKEVTRSYGD